MSPINSTTQNQYSSKQQNSSFSHSKLLLSSSRLRPLKSHPVQIGWTPLISVTASSLVIVSSLLIAASSFSSSSYLVDAYPVMMSPNELLRKHNPVMAIEIDNPEEVLSVLDNLIQSILVGIDYQHQQHGSQYQNNGGLGNNNNNNQNMLNQNQNLNNIDKSLGSKRGIDLGLSRGFSGNQAAKHLMGMSAASFANGPGRRR